MEKKKRIIGDIIDLYIFAISSAFILTVLNIIVKLIFELDFELVIFSIDVGLLIPGFLTIIVETFLFKGKSIGKRIMKLKIEPDSVNEKVLVLLGRRIVIMFFWIISFVLIIMFNRSLGDIIFSTKVVKDD